MASSSRVLTLLSCLLLWACKENEEGAEQGKKASAEESAAQERLSPEPVVEKGGDKKTPPISLPQKPAEKLFADKIRGLRLKRSIVVRGQAHLEGEKLGTVAAHTVVGWRQAKVGEGCESRWIEIRPRGWVCEEYLEPVERAPQGAELPKLAPGERVPGDYGKVVGEEAKLVVFSDSGEIKEESEIVGSSTVRKRGSKMVGEELFWKIDGGKYIAESNLRIHKPSNYRGAFLADTSSLRFPLGFAYSSKRPGDWVSVLSSPGGPKVRRLRAREVVSILGEKKNSDGKLVAYQIGESEYVMAKDMRVAKRVAAPPTTRAFERWFDVDLDQQILVAYEGEEPVYATMVSTGTKKNPTETGIFRIWIKFSETNMSGRMGESDAYSVATVPWTQFYENDFALHTSYWHDRFGQKRSHGCINLSPRDSRFLYFWSDPQVPPGWSMANGTLESPGSMVRVHSKKDPNPEFFGYGKRVYEHRLANEQLTNGE